MRNSLLFAISAGLIFCVLVSACTPEMIPTQPQPAALTALPVQPVSSPTAPAVNDAPTLPPVLLPPSPTPAKIPPATPVPTLSKTLTVGALPTSSSLKQETPAVNVVPLKTPLDTQMQALVDQAKADLGKKLSIQAAQVELVEVGSVTWPDSSLGCPKPGMAYAQVMTEGYLIRLKASGQTYEYHGGGIRTPFLCQ
jgi:hypothetical protein